MLKQQQKNMNLIFSSLLLSLKWRTILAVKQKMEYEEIEEEKTKWYRLNDSRKLRRSEAHK